MTKARPPNLPVNARIVKLVREPATTSHQFNSSSGGGDVPEIVSPQFSDDALALRFAERHRHSLRFVAKWGRWLRWDGCRWRIDHTYLAYDLVRPICREAARKCLKEGEANSLTSAKTIAAVERTAKADRRLAATVEQWDSNPWLLNIGGGSDENN